MPTKLYRCLIGVLLAALLGQPRVIAGTSAGAGDIPSKEYLAGALSYCVMAGYVVRAGEQIAREDVVSVYLRREPTPPELGRSVLYEVAVPSWSFYLELRKANYYGKGVDIWMRNSDFRIGGWDNLRWRTVGKGWLNYSVTHEDLIRASQTIRLRRIPDTVKRRIIDAVLLGEKNADRSAKNFLFAPLGYYENIIWVFRRDSKILYSVSLDDDLEDENITSDLILMNMRQWDLEKIDLVDGPLNRADTAAYLEAMYGLWHCIAGK